MSITFWIGFLIFTAFIRYLEKFPEKRLRVIKQLDKKFNWVEIPAEDFPFDFKSGSNYGKDDYCHHNGNTYKVEWEHCTIETEDCMKAHTYLGVKKRKE